MVPAFDRPTEGSRVVKLYVDLTSKVIRVSRESDEKRDENGKQKVERNTGRPMWTTQLFVQDTDGGEVITVTTVGERPTMKIDTVVVPVGLEVIPWCQTKNGQHRSGIAYRATELKPAAAVKAA
jgi:hypothetical protein